MDTYNQFLGYSPYAPTIAGYGYQNSVPAPTTDATVPMLAAPSTSVSVSGSFAVAGWLAALIIGLAAYRYIWESAE